MPATPSVIPKIPKVPKVKLPKAKIPVRAYKGKGELSRGSLRSVNGIRGVVSDAVNDVRSMSEQVARRRAVEALSRDILATFGERDALVHFFARKKWTQIEGGNWKSEGGRVLSDASYKKLQQRLAGGGGGGSPASPPASATPAPPPPAAIDPAESGRMSRVSASIGGEMAANRAAGVAKEILAGVRPLPPGWTPEMAKRAVQLTGADAAKARGQTTVVNTPAVQPGGLRKAAPPPTPAESAHFDAARAKDESRFGPRAAGILHKAANAVRGFLATVAGGLTMANGAAYGALGGMALAGPLGLAFGTALGGGLGFRAGRHVTNKTYAMLGGANRARAMARVAARKVVPKAVGAVVGGPGMVASAGLPAVGASLGGPLGLAAGTALGTATGIGGLEAGSNAAKIARSVMATSPVSERKAKKANDEKYFSERFAEDGLPPNAVAVLKARLRVAAQKAGVTLPPIPDEVVAAALRMAAQDDQVATMSEFCREFVKFRRHTTARR